MNRTTPFALLTNNSALPWADVPEWPLPEFLRNVGAELDRGERLSSLFGVPEGGALRLVAVLAFDAGNTLAVSDSITLDMTLPAGTLAINGGAAYTNATAATLNSSVSDASALQMRFQDAGGAWSDWRAPRAPTCTARDSWTRARCRCSTRKAG